MFRPLIQLLLCVLASPAMAQDVRQRTTPMIPAEAWVGQRLVVIVELLSPTFFSGTPAFDLPQVSGVTLVPPSERPVLSTETVGEQTYTVQRHELSVIAHRAGRVTIPGFPVRFEISGGIGEPPLERRIVTDAIEFETRSPPGAEGLSSLISTSSLTVDDHWSPEGESAKVGDAITHRVTFRAVDVPAMAFPPLPALAVQGAATYGKTPEVTDRSDRGTLVGERVETITYVCQSPGRVVIPSYVLTWWDLDDHTLRTEQISGRTLEVASLPVEAAPPRRAGWPAGVAIGAAIAALVGVIWVGRRRIRACFAEWRWRWRESEPGRFAAFRRSCRAGDPREVNRALTMWRVAWQAKASGRPLSASDDPLLRQEWNRLQAHLYGAASASTDDWSPAALYERVRILRHSRRNMRTAARPGPPPPGDLQPLNPVDSCTP